MTEFLQESLWHLPFLVIDAMVDCGCCNDVAVSPNLQLFYGVVCILYVLSSLGEFLAAGMDGPDMMLACVTMSTLFVIMVLWILMLASRCCAPCCCREAVPDVPPTCPLGPCQTSNPKCLDYPFMIGMGGEVVTEGTRRVVLPACLYTNFIRGEWDFSPLQLCRLLWVTLLILGTFTSLKKYQIMRKMALHRLWAPAKEYFSEATMIRVYSA